MLTGKKVLDEKDAYTKMIAAYAKYKRVPTAIEWDSFGGRWSYTSVQRQFGNLTKLAKAAGIKIEEYDFEELAKMPHKKKLQLFESLEKQNTLLSKENDKLKNFQHTVVLTVEAALAKMDPIKIEVPKPYTGSGHFEHANLLFSDEQIGTCFDASETMGKNVYNFDTFLANNKILRDSVIKITQLHSKAYAIPRLNIWAAGDDVEGELIFKGQQLSIDRPLIDQTMDGAHAIAETLITWAQVFPEIHVYQVWGNHGRSGTGKGDAHPRSNWDSVLWKIVEMVCKYSGISNIIFHLSMSTTLVANILGHNILLSHGNETKGWMGIPFYGRSRDVSKMVNALELPIKLALCGHHHNIAAWDIAPHCQIMMNGSWVGGSPYSTTELKTINTPKQLMWGTSKGRVKTWSYDIELHSIRKLTQSKNGLYTPTYPTEKRNAKKK